jgi:hypothetical protein
MAHRADKTQEIVRLLESSAASRAVLGHQFAVLKRRLDAPAKVLRAVRSHPFRWVGGAALAGLSLPWLFRRKASAPAPAPARRVLRASAWLWPILFTAAKPALKAWATGQLQTFLSARLAHPPKTVQHPPADAPDTLRRSALIR